MSTPLPSPSAGSQPEGTPLYEGAEISETATGQVIAGHRYDGIREYDNPMPRWWVSIFWLTVVFSPIYVLGVHVFGWLPTYQGHLANQTAELAAVREAYAAANPAFSTEPEVLAAYVASPDNAAAGAATFAAVCAACHGDKGQGTIGPNLTDDHWIHGASPAEVYALVTHGAVEKGMPAWEAALSDEERGQLTAFIASLRGTNPPGAKAPQGEKVDG